MRHNDLEAQIVAQSEQLTVAQRRAHLNEPGDLDRAVEARRLLDLAHSAGSLIHEQAAYEHLVAQRANRDAAVADHAVAVEANKAGLTELGGQLDAERAELAQAVETTIAAIAALHAATSAYNERLAVHADELRQGGMPAEYQDGDIRAVHATGGYLPGLRHKPALKLDGKSHHPLPPQAVLRYATDAALASVLPGFDDANKRTSTVHAALDPIVQRPKSLPAETPSWAGIIPRRLGAPTIRTDGTISYGDGWTSKREINRMTGEGVDIFYRPDGTEDRRVAIKLDPDPRFAV